MTRSERDIQRWPMTAKIGIRVKLIISDRLVLSKSSHFLVPRCNRVVQISRSRKILQFESFCFFRILFSLELDEKHKKRDNSIQKDTETQMIVWKCSKFARLWIRSSQISRKTQEFQQKPWDSKPQSFIRRDRLVAGRYL